MTVNRDNQNGEQHKVSKFSKALRDYPLLVLDGAFATELESYGCDLKDPLWSAKVLIDQPELVKKVHISYLAVGVDIIESAGYQATVEGFKAKGFAIDEAIALVKKSVRTAVEARNEFLAAKTAGQLEVNGIAIGTLVDGAPVYPSDNSLEVPLVAASVGPYGAFLAEGSEYSGDYGVTVEALEAFHRPRIELFSEENPDLFACETVPCLDEAKAIGNILSDESVTKGIPGWITFSCKDEAHTCGGDHIGDCAAYIDTIDAIQGIGINCTQPKFVGPLIERIKERTNKAIVVYPNTGELYDDVNKIWYGEAEAFDAYAKEWARLGARVIGGCCRTSPVNIGAIVGWVHEG